jgi:hypothetical protein
MKSTKNYPLVLIAIMLLSCSSQLRFSFAEMHSLDKFNQIQITDISNEYNKKIIGLYNFMGVKVNNRNYNKDTLGYWIRLNEDGSMQDIHDNNGLIKCEKGEWKLFENQLYLKYVKDDPDSSWVWVWYLKGITDDGILVKEKNNNKVLIPKVNHNLDLIIIKCK